MNTRSRIVEKKLSRKAVFGAMLLACSGGAFAQAPDAPHIDWIEIFDEQQAPGDWANLDIGWSATGLEPATSVQYRLGGVPILSHGLSRWQDYGQTVLPIRNDSEYELTVALCNSDGCGESTPVKVSNAEFESGDAPTAISLSQDEVHRELERIRASTELLTQTYGAPGSDLYTSAAAAPLISVLAKAALSGFVRSGGDFAFLALMDHLGMGHDDFGAQIGQLQSSMNALNTQVAELTRAIEDLHDVTTWQGFLNQHKDANIAVNLVYANFGHVTGWIDNNVQVDDFAWTAARNNIADALTILAGAKMNAAGGIVDTRDGAIYQLMNAIPQRVASTKSYWPLVDEYRDYYRAALAVGFLGLDLIEDHFDGSGTTRVMADDAMQVGQRAVLAMYTYGIAPAVSAGKDFVQLRGSVDGYASTAFAGYGGGASVSLAGSQLRSAFAQMAADHRPEHVGGLTLEALLTQAGVATTYVIDNTGGWNGTGWQATLIRAGQPKLGHLPRYWIGPLIGRVRGNQWTETYEPYCGYTACKDGHYIEISNQGQIQTYIDNGKSNIRNGGGYYAETGIFAKSHYGAIDLTNRLNHAGRAAEFDPAAVRFEAFGDGVFVLDEN